MRIVRNTLKGSLFLVLVLFITLADFAYRQVPMPPGLFIGRALLYAALLFLLLLFSEKLYAALTAPGAESRQPSFWGDSRRSFLLLSLLFFAVYVCFLLVYSPGTCGWDTINQILDLTTGFKPLPFDWIEGQPEVSALMNDHHPVFTTLVFTFFYRIGLFLGDANLGMLLYNLIQISLLSFLYAATVCRLGRLGVPRPVRLFFVFFYCMPFMALYSLTMLKDTMFSFLLLLYFLCFTDIIRNAAGSGEMTKRESLRLILLSLAIALTNKKGIYIAFLSNLCLLPLFRSRPARIRAFCCAFIPLLTVTVLLGQILFPLFRIYPGGKQEALGFSFQQTAGMMIEDPDSFSKEEKALFFRIIDIPPEELEARYDPKTTDPVKDGYNFYSSDTDLASYLKMWLSHTVRHPVTALRILLEVNGGFFAPVKAADVYATAAYSDRLGAFRQWERTEHYREVVNMLYDAVEKLPPVSVLFLDALYLFWLPVAAAFLLMRHCSKKALLCLVPVFLNMVFLILGPVCWTRYGLCQYCTFPVWASLPFVFNSKRGS